MNQLSFLHETLLDAIRADIEASGSFKVVGPRLWPADPHAAQKLRNCMNPDQPHKLAPEEVLQVKRIAYEHGSTYAVDFDARELGFVCTWVEPADQMEQLTRETNELLKAALKRQERIERMKESFQPFKVVK